MEDLSLSATEDTELAAKRAKQQARAERLAKKAAEKSTNINGDTAVVAKSEPAETKSAKLKSAKSKSGPDLSEAASTTDTADAPAPSVAAHVTVRPTIGRTRRRGRHVVVLLSFVVWVILPTLATAWYLYERAADQYASYVGFSVRTEESNTAIESILGSTPLSSSSSADTDILYEFLQSQQLVADIDAELDIRTMWAKPGVQMVWPWEEEEGLIPGDPIFAYHGGTIEDLIDHWKSMVQLSYDSATSLLEIRVLAFDPDDAQAISTQLFERASAMINQLSAVAREDAISYARDELSDVEARLKNARLEIQAFRNRTQIVDPTIQTQTQSGLVSALESQLAEAQIERAILGESGVRDGDPRLIQADRRIDVIERQIAEERAKLGIDGAGGVADDRQTVADIVGEYEALQVDLEFAQQAFTAARSNFDSAQAEARRQTRYLAAHITPTRAERAEYPQRMTLIGFMALFLFLSWAVMVLVVYALRDRR